MKMGSENEFAGVTTKLWMQQAVCFSLHLLRGLLNALLFTVMVFPLE